MRIHIISTINGIQNEGMRNVATHISEYFERTETVYHSSLKEILKIPLCCLKSDVTMIFARCTGKTYMIAKLARVFCRNLWMVLVQKPQTDFIEKNDARPLDCNYLTICGEDAGEIRLCKGRQVFGFDAGINTQKFTPVPVEEQKRLKNKYGFDTEKPIVLHVGHCSKGRGLEDLKIIDSGKASVLVVASGMFENADTVRNLESAGVKLMTGYIENINEIYQMADVYVFPTKSDDFVISVPLSVMEALACGVPVVAYKEFSKIKAIPVNSENAITLIDNSDMLGAAVDECRTYKREESYLLSPKSWDESASEIHKTVKGSIK